MPGHRHKRNGIPKSPMKGTNVKCLCEKEMLVTFRKPKLGKTTEVEKACECGTRWSFTFKNAFTIKQPGTFLISPRAISISQKAAAVMKEKADARAQFLTDQLKPKGEPNADKPTGP